MFSMVNDIDLVLRGQRGWRSAGVPTSVYDEEVFKLTRICKIYKFYLSYNVDTDTYCIYRSRRSYFFFPPGGCTEKSKIAALRDMYGVYLLPAE